jgi:hypothetical protein
MKAMNGAWVMRNGDVLCAGGSEDTIHMLYTVDMKECL